MIEQIFKTFGDTYLFVDGKNPKMNLRYQEVAQYLHHEVDLLQNCSEKHFFFPLTKDPRFYFVSLLAALVSKKTLLPLLSPHTQIKHFAPYPLIARKQKAQAPNLEVSDEFPFLALQTSGSTGEAKLWGLTLKNIYLSAKASIDFYRMKAGAKHHLFLPLHHIGGNMVLWRAFFSGGTIYYNDDSLQEQCDYISLVPLQLKRNIENPLLKNYQAIILGGEKCPQELIDLIKSKHLPVSLTYGMTETCAQVTATPPGKVSFECVGQALAHRLVTLREGKVSIDSEANARYLFKEGNFIKTLSSLLLTQDLADFVESELFIRGRSDEIFISAGENISPQEIENSLTETLLYKKVLPVADQDFGQVPALFYLGAQPAEELYYQLKKKLPPYKIPKYFVKLPELAPDKIKYRKEDLVTLWKDLYQSSHRKQELKIYLHGFLGDAQDFSFLRKDDALFLTLPGHGNYKDFSFCQLDDYLEAIIKAYKLSLYSKITLCGYSQGGRVALGLASKLPNVTKLTLIAAHPGLEDEDQRRERWQQDQKMLEGKTLNSFLDFWYKQSLFALSPEEQAHAKKLRVDNTIDSLKKSLKLFSLGLQPSYWKFIENYKGELNYVFGQKDLKYIDLGQKINTLNPTCKLFEIADSGHNPLLFHQEELLKLKVLD